MGRGNQVYVTDEWLELLNGEVRLLQTRRHPRYIDEAWTLKELGEALGESLDRPMAWSGPSVSRYLRGQLTTDAMTLALSMFFDLPSPMLSARAPAECEWFNLGQALRDADPTAFARIVDDVRDRLHLIDRAANVSK